MATPKRAIMINWNYFQDKSDLCDQLSRSALYRIAKGLHKTSLATAVHTKYPDAADFMAWRQDQQQTVQACEKSPSGKN